MQLQDQTSEATAASDWIVAELVIVSEVLIFLVLGYVATAAVKRFCSRELQVHPKKLEAEDNAPIEQPAATEIEELMTSTPTKTAAQTRYANAQERKRIRKANEPEKTQKAVAVSVMPLTAQTVRTDAKKAEKKHRKAQSQKVLHQKVEAIPDAPAGDSEAIDMEDNQTAFTPTSPASFEEQSHSEVAPLHISATSMAPAPNDIEVMFDSCPARIDNIFDVTDEKPNDDAIDGTSPSGEKLQGQDEDFGFPHHAEDDQEQLSGSTDATLESSDTASRKSFGLSGLAVKEEDQEIAEIEAAQTETNIGHEIFCLENAAWDEFDKSKDQVPKSVISDLSDGSHPCEDAACDVRFDDIMECDNVSEHSFQNIKTPSEAESLPQLASAPVMWCMMPPYCPSVADEDSAFPEMVPQTGCWMTVAMPAECAPPGVLDGLWVNDADEKILIARLEIMFESGITWDMTMHSLTEISVTIDGEKFTAELDETGRRLFWSDGDVWTLSGQAQQSSEEMQQLAPEALSELSCMTPADLFAFPYMMVPVAPESMPAPPAPKSKRIPRNAEKWEVCWDWRKKGCCPRGADCDWYHPTPESHIF